ncbi:MAG TPA: hypothetical protein VGK01_24845 [Candidatus Angelobacter sp.]
MAVYGPTINNCKLANVGAAIDWNNERDRGWSAPFWPYRHRASKLSRFYGLGYVGQSIVFADNGRRGSHLFEPAWSVAVVTTREGYACSIISHLVAIMFKSAVAHVHHEPSAFRVYQGFGLLPNDSQENQAASNPKDSGTPVKMLKAAVKCFIFFFLLCLYGLLGYRTANAESGIAAAGFFVLSMCAWVLLVGVFSELVMRLILWRNG